MTDTWGIKNSKLEKSTKGEIQHDLQYEIIKPVN